MLVCDSRAERGMNSAFGNDRASSGLLPTPGPMFPAGRSSPTAGRGVRGSLSATPRVGQARFLQGETANFFSEFEILEEISVPPGTFRAYQRERRPRTRQGDVPVRIGAPPPVRRATRVRFHWSVGAALVPRRIPLHGRTRRGRTRRSYQEYVEGPLSYADFSHRVREHCRVDSTPAPSRSHGAPTTSSLTTAWPTFPAPSRPRVVKGRRARFGSR